MLLATTGRGMGVQGTAACTIRLAGQAGEGAVGPEHELEFEAEATEDKSPELAPVSAHWRGRADCG